MERIETEKRVCCFKKLFMKPTNQLTIVLCQQDKLLILVQSQICFINFVTQLEKERKEREEREKRDAEEAAERQRREQEWVRMISKKYQAHRL